ncbi:MAG TPA: hypothetical protein VGR77_00240 [Candidatus Dormibacteraeota bacterium]|nr:hypothetical protein [Candidatus Dormibacteraeota bacterium]
MRRQIVRPGLSLIVAALLLAGCGGAAASPPTPSATATATPLSQPFRLFTHCGIVTTYFAGRTFYLEELDPARVPYLGNPEAPGVMMLVSPHVAEFADPAGHRIRFVDELPGALNTPYPFAVHVLSGGNRIIDEPFAGRHWHTAETLPGIVGPPYGNGLDRFTVVPGTFTILDAEDAVFRSDAGAVVHFTALPLAGCD